MKLRLAVSLVMLSAVLCGQPPRRGERPVRLASRGTHGAVAAGTEYATEAGMRMYVHGGNAVDAGVATMLAASVVEFSHFGLGGEAPILVRTKDGKVHAIAGVGTMPKLASAQFFRDHKLSEDEVVSPPEKGGMKEWIPVAGILPALVPGMIEAALVTLREYGTKSFAEAIQPATTRYSRSIRPSSSCAAAIRTIALLPCTRTIGAARLAFKASSGFPPSSS